MSRKELDELQQQIPLRDYLEAYDWRPVRRLSRGRWMGLCPLHPDRQPSFLMDPGKNLFYCYGCGRGGDVIRFAELYHQVRFPQALALLHQWRGGAPLLQKVASFYRMQLHRHAEAVAYLHHRGLRSPGTDRARAHRLCAWRLPSRLADMVGLYAPQSVKPVWSPPWDTTPTSVASFFRWKATSMAAVCQQRRRRHRLLPGNRVGCICGSQFGNLRK